MNNVTADFDLLECFCACISEFASFVSNSNCFEHKLMEFGNLIIDNDAIFTVSNYFVKKWLFFIDYCLEPPVSFADSPLIKGAKFFNYTFLAPLFKGADAFMRLRVLFIFAFYIILWYNYVTKFYEGSAGYDYSWN